MVASIGHLLQQAIGQTADPCQQKGIKKVREKGDPIVLRHPLTRHSQEAARLTQQFTDIGPRGDKGLHLLLLPIQEGVEGIEIGEEPAKKQTPIQPYFGFIHTTHSFSCAKVT